MRQPSPLITALALALVACGGSPPAEEATPEDASAQARPLGTDPAPEATNAWRSALYPADWTPAFNLSSDRFLHDFSYAGYHNGEDAWGTPPGAFVVDMVTLLGADNTGATDLSPLLRDAIELGAQAPLVLYFPPGLYRFDSRVTIPYDEVVIRGAGSDLTQLYFTAYEGMSNRSHITFQKGLRSGQEVPLARDGVNRETFVEVANAAGLSVGDDIAIGWVITPEFIEEHDMTGTWEAFNDTWQPFFWREIVGIDTSVSPARIRLDVPLRYPSKVRDAASIRVQTGYLSECGIEHLALGDATGWDEAWTQNQIHLVEMTGVKDCWMDDVKSFRPPTAPDSGYGADAHLQSGGLMVKLAKRVTIADSRMEKAQNRGGGGNGYLFEIRQSNEILTRDSVARDGRHNFIQNWGFGTTGCVWLRVDSKGSRQVQSAEYPIPWLTYSETHHSLATANLVDESRFDDGWSVKNRHDWSTGAGHTGTQMVAWNTSGHGVLESFQFGQGYVIGTDKRLHVRTKLRAHGAYKTAPEDYTEGLGNGEALSPRSLYDDQLRRRLEAR